MTGIRSRASAGTGFAFPNSHQGNWYFQVERKEADNEHDRTSHVRQVFAYDECAAERVGRNIVLFTTEVLTLKEANARLADASFHGVMRLDEVSRLEKISVLRTSKIDYRRRRPMICSNTPDRTLDWLIALASLPLN